MGVRLDGDVTWPARQFTEAPHLHSNVTHIQRINVPRGYIAVAVPALVALIVAAAFGATIAVLLWIAR